MKTFELWWCGECIDTADSRESAEYLAGEYFLAFGSEHPVEIRDEDSIYLPGEEGRQ